MAKKKRLGRNRRATAARSKKQTHDKPDFASVVDAVAEIVHQGFGRMFDPGELIDALDGWKPNSIINYEYVFVWNPDAASPKRANHAARQCLEEGIDCKWADLSFITDRNGRDVFVLVMADAVVGNDDDIDSIIDRHEEIWRWKSQPLTIVGPFASVQDAEAWMAHNGAFEEMD